MELQHHGIRGMKWGRRRFQNDDGSLTSAGRVRYGDDSPNAKPNLRSNGMVVKGGSRPKPNMSTNGMSTKSVKKSFKERQAEKKANKVALKESKKAYDSETKSEFKKQKGVTKKAMYGVKRVLNRPASSIYGDKPTTAGKAVAEVVATRIGNNLVSKYRDAQFNKFVSDANAESAANKAEFERFMNHK